MLRHGFPSSRRLARTTRFLPKLLDRAVDKRVFGTKMGAVVQQATASGIDAIVAQQFELATAILEKGLVPIIEPEVEILLR